MSIRIVPSKSLNARWNGISIVGLRARLKMNQTDFSKLIGVGICTISRWERGISVPLPVFQEKLDEIARKVQKEED